LKQIFKPIVVIVFFSTMLSAMGFPQSYYKIKNSKDQKREFINILKPFVDTSNEKILEERFFIENFFKKAISNAFRSMNPNDLKKLQRLSKKYRVKNIFDKNKYLKRIDLVPVSLALVQGAIESGWGKSRFVREANNIFGHWTWGEVGIIPLGREEGKTHKIRIFRSIQDSVDAYMLNLNRHYAYQDFRDMRLKKSLKGKQITGYEAANTMLNYSELREKYIKMLHNMMEEHRLLYYDVVKKHDIESKVGL